MKKRLKLGDNNKIFIHNLQRSLFKIELEQNLQLFEKNYAKNEMKFIHIV